MKNKYLKSNNFDDIYRELLKQCKENPDYTPESRGRKSRELINVSFTLTNPNDNLVNSESRDFNMDFAKRFYEWIINGESDTSLLFDVNKNAQKYSDKKSNGDHELKDRNTAYGPRLLEQLDETVNELVRDPGSRRAIIHILEKGDQEMLEDSFNGLTKVEYPCTFQLMFLIRENKLNLHVGMRSNNLVKTICYDVYNFTNIQNHVLNILKDRGLNLELGNYEHNIVSGHFFEDELPLVDKILEENKIVGV
jgi:thymidylate synthase